MKRLTLLLIACIVLALCATHLATPTPANASASQQITWTQIWADEFNAGANTGANTGNWLYDLGHCYPGCPAGNWGTGEIENMTNSTANVYHTGSGQLAIKPIRDGAGNWSSGRIETQRTDFQPPAGGRLAIEGRMQLPNVSGAGAQGYWPAFWTLGAPFRGVYTNWPSAGEIDIMENVNGANQVWGTLHCGVSPGGPCNETTGLGGNRVMGSPSLQTSYHTYRIEFDKSVSPQQLRWYVDGIQYHTVNANQVDATTWNNATNHGFFVILNVAIGGGWPGGPTGSTVSGQPMLVDYVRVFTSGGGGGVPTNTAVSATRTRTPTPGGPTPTRTRTPTPGGTGRDAFARIEAESANAQSGITFEACSEGGQNAGFITNGDYLVYNNVNFGTGGAVRVDARVASGAAGGVSGIVEFHLDSLTGTKLGDFAIANTGGWQVWRTVPANSINVTGTHTVYVRFVSGQPADFVNLNWFQFSR